MDEFIAAMPAEVREPFLRSLARLGFQTAEARFLALARQDAEAQEQFESDQFLNRARNLNAAERAAVTEQIDALLAQREASQ